MPSCVFRFCTNYESKVNKAQGITYHAFPVDEVRLQEWIEIVRIQRSEIDWTPSKSSTICSIHFNSDDAYNTKTGRALLKKHALPVIEQSENEVINNSLRSSIDSDYTQDTKEIIDPPITVALKKRIRELIFQKKQIRKRNKIIIEQNKRLKKSVVALGVILKDLQKKNYISKGRFLKSKLKLYSID